MQEVFAYLENVWTFITDLIDHLPDYNLSFYLSQIYTYDFNWSTALNPTKFLWHFLSNIYFMNEYIKSFT